MKDIKDLFLDKYPNAVVKKALDVGAGALCVTDDRWMTPFIKGRNEGSNPRCYVLDTNGKIVGKYVWSNVIVLESYVEVKDTIATLERAEEEAKLAKEELRDIKMAEAEAVLQAEFGDI